MRRLLTSRGAGERLRPPAPTRPPRPDARVPDRVDRRPRWSPGPAAPLLLALALLLASCGAPTLSGTDLGKTPAPDFTLLDGPTGERVTLSALRGRVVVLSFLYTSCPDTCPLTAEKLRMARDALGDASKEVAFVAVSVDPARDTPEATRRFVEQHRLSGTLRFLIGDAASLRGVWAKYFIGAERQGALVSHNDAIFLIDRQGRERALLHSDLEVERLARDLRALLGEPRLF